MPTPPDSPSRIQLGSRLVRAGQSEHAPFGRDPEAPPVCPGLGAGSGPTEHSAMFSLDALAARAQPSTTPGYPADHDSGLIDLRALAAGRDPSAAADEPIGYGAGSVFPLGAPNPTAPRVARPVTAPRHPSAAASGERLLVAVLATVAVLLGAMVIFLLVRQGSHGPATELSRAPNDVAAAEPTAPSEVGILSPTSRPEPDRPGASAESAVPVAAASPPTGPTAASRPPSGGAPSRPPATATPAPLASHAAASACPCPPDDLMCHMRCRVGR